MSIGFKQEKGTEQDKTDSTQKEYDDLTQDSVGKEKVSPDKKVIVVVSCVLALIVLVLFVSIKISIDNKEPKEPKESNQQNEEQTNSNVLPDTIYTGDSVTENETNSSAVYDADGNLISENGVYDLEGNVIDSSAINPGMPSYEESENNKTTSKIFDSSEFIKDLNGLDVSAVYNVRSRDYVQDYVSYVAKRAIIDEGMELYWLETTYNKKKYRIQVPFYRFKDLNDEGICKVEIEVLSLEGGEKIISYMQVIPDVNTEAD